MTKHLCALLMLLLLFAPLPSHAQSVAPGLYRASQGPELAAQLEIRPDGHFSYFLAYGALDEQAEGTWTATEKGIALTTLPKPKPPVFRLDHEGREGIAPFHILVLGPNGQGIAGVDIRLGFESGAIMTGYTQDYGWTLGQSALGTPLWIELVEPIHGLISPRFMIGNATRTMKVTLIPNDLGIAAFEHTLFEAKGEGEFVLHHPMDKIRFRLVQP